jgi:hypothetical protein
LLAAGGCDKKKSQPCGAEKGSHVISASVIPAPDAGPTETATDAWQPPPVIVMPDAFPWAKHAKITLDDPEIMASKAAIRAQHALIEDSAEQLEEIQDKLEKAKKAVKKRRSGGRKAYDKWRKAAGKKLPKLPIESKMVNLPSSGEGVSPRIMRDDGGDP